MYYYNKRGDIEGTMAFFTFTVLNCFLGFGVVCSSIPFYQNEKIVVSNSFSNNERFVVAICQDKDGDMTYSTC